MKSTLLATTLAVLLLAAAPGFAGERSVTLKVDGMVCAACPFIVKKSLTRVDGVTAVSVSLSEKKADVTYDDSRTDVDTLVAATTDNGFPSTPMN